MVSEQSILGHNYGFNPVTTPHPDMMKMLAELPILSSSSGEYALYNQPWPPPAPPHPLLHPFYTGQYSSPSWFYQYNNFQYTAPQVFDEMTVRNLSPTHTPAIHTSPYTLTVQTTLSTGQPYFAIEPTTMFENANSFGKLSPGSESLNIGCETEVAEIDMKIVREAGEVYSKIETETIACEVEAITEIENETELKSETNKDFDVVEMKVVASEPYGGKSKAGGFVVVTSEAEEEKHVSGTEVFDDLHGDISTFSIDSKDTEIYISVDSSIVEIVKVASSKVEKELVNYRRSLGTNDVKSGDEIYSTLLEVTKFDSSHDWGDVVCISTEDETEPVQKVEGEIGPVRKVKGDAKPVGNKYARIVKPRMPSNGQRTQLMANHSKLSLIKIDGPFNHYSAASFYEDSRFIDSECTGKKVLDHVHDTCIIELEENDLAYDGERSMLTFGTFPRHKLKFIVVLEDNSLIRSNRNYSPDHANENDMKRLRCLCHSKTYKEEISSATRIPMQPLLQALQGQNSERSQVALRVLDIILTQHVAKQGCLLDRQSYFHNDVNNFTDVGNCVLGCLEFHSSGRIIQGGILLNTMIIQLGFVVNFLTAINHLDGVIEKLRATKELRIEEPILYIRMQIAMLNFEKGDQKEYNDNRCTLDNMSNIDASVHASFYWISLQYHKCRQEFAEFYKSALLYLACTSVEHLSESYKLDLAFNLCLSAPQLKVRNREYFYPCNGLWNFNDKELVEPTTMEQWVVNFTARCSIPRLINHLMKCGGMKEINIAWPFDVFGESPQHKNVPPLVVVGIVKTFQSIQSKLPGYHGDNGVYHANVILPAVAVREKEGTYVNTEGYGQKTLPGVLIVGDTRGEQRQTWDILKQYSEFVSYLKYVRVERTIEKEITYKKYALFYKSLTNSWVEELVDKCFSVEGQLGFEVILFISKRAQSDLLVTHKKAVENFF